MASFKTLAVLLALFALLSIALALPGPGTCTCKNGKTSNVNSCDSAECYNFCNGMKAAGGEKCVTKPKRAAFGMETSPITETEAVMVQKAMFAIPCDLCEVTVADVQKIPEASCVSALDNACKVVQKKFPQVKCSNLLETLACGVVRTLLESQTPAQICTQVAKCQAPAALEMQPAAVVPAAAPVAMWSSFSNFATLAAGVPFSDCSAAGHTLQVSAVSLSPNPPQKGQNVAITISGNLAAAVGSATAQLTVSLGAFQVLAQNFQLPASAAGPVTQTVTISVPGFAPSGQYTAKGVITSGGQQLACITANFNL